ncbi:MAG: hypothetical protein KKA67_16165 [Spirochaetes bacterium]|nr:hypothetical protein [Spirochaetota bacterium]MBU1080437.1 hypothetical protein [Spirochaetota bacterium]
MVDQGTLARVNLFAVLRTLEGLPAHDDEARKIANGKREVIQFTVGGVGKARLAIGGGKIAFMPGGGGATINLWFPDGAKLNAMFAGTGNPIPLKGLTKIGYLKGPFTALTDRLTHYLRAKPELLKDAKFRAANSELSLHVAFYALSEIANADPDGRLNAGRMTDGAILIAAKGGPALTIAVKDGRLETRNGDVEVPGKRARMVFSSLDAAGQLIRGELSSYLAIGTGDVSLGGYTPIIDHMNKLLGLVPRYLS